MTNRKNPGDPAAAALSRAVDQLCEAVRVAIAAGLMDAAVTSRTRRVTQSVARQLSARRRAQRAAALVQVILKRNPTPELARQQADIRERQARLIAERNAREREAMRMHELRTELITAGHRALAKKYHPDAGGSGEDMARLNRIRTTFIAAIAGIGTAAAGGLRPTGHPAGGIRRRG